MNNVGTTEDSVVKAASNYDLDNPSEVNGSILQNGNMEGNLKFTLAFEDKQLTFEGD